MGGTSTSSKRKSSSSSLKKKRSASTSQVRKRRRRSKIRKGKARKLRRRDDSISSSDDDSRSVSSISSSSSSDGDHRRRRSRSRTRKDVKKRSNKSTRRRSSSSESSPDARRVKKKNGSKRKVELDIKKKRRSKKSKRYVNVSSSSSRSRSCSTNRGDVSGEESEYEKRRGRSERMEDASKKNIKRPSKDDGYEYQQEEKMVSENNLSRLRSVITVPKGQVKSDERELEKEEIIYDRDEYPSCKSNDSNDMGVERESDHYSHDVMSSRTNEITVNPIDEDDRYDGNFPISDVVEENNRSIKSDVEDSVVIVSPESPANVDLELILRQRALENLKKFRGGHQTKTAADEKENDNQVGNKEDVARVSSATHVVDQNNETLITKINARSSQKNENIQVRGYNKPRSAASKIIQLKFNKEEITNKAKYPIPSSQDDRKLQDDIKKACRSPRLVGTGHSKDSEIVSKCTLQGQGSTSQIYAKGNQLESDGEISNTAFETSKTLLHSCNNNDEQLSNASGSTAPGASSIEPLSDDQGSKEVQGEAKDGSQYEQKTMSVMRGGEMVQVSYKVYIPKKTPALARRQLKR